MRLGGPDVSASGSTVLNLARTPGWLSTHLRCQLKPPAETRSFQPPSKDDEQGSIAWRLRVPFTRQPSLQRSPRQPDGHHPRHTQPFHPGRITFITGHVDSNWSDDCPPGITAGKRNDPLKETQRRQGAEAQRVPGWLAVDQNCRATARTSGQTSKEDWMLCALAPLRYSPAAGAVG